MAVPQKTARTFVARVERPVLTSGFVPGSRLGAYEIPAVPVAKRPEISLQTMEQFVVKMFETDPDFLFTVTRDFTRSCQNPILVLPDDVPAHPLEPAMECAMLAPRAEVSIFPWKQPRERIRLAVRQIRSFLRAHRPAQQAWFGSEECRQVSMGRLVSAFRRDQ